MHVRARVMQKVSLFHSLPNI